ncbi:MAG: hypothetical protein WC975_04370 [Phycisphaerae bacterium]
MAIQDLARQLLALEAARAESSDGHVDETVCVCEKLRVTLSKFMGIAGFASLLSWALARTKAQIPSLSGVKVRTDGTLEGFDRVQDKPAAGKAGAVLVSHLLGLLVTLVGKPLTLRLVRDAWPDTDINSMDFLNGVKS